MLSFFPYLFSFEPLAPLLLRLTLGAVLLYWSYGKIKRKESAASTTLGLVELVAGFLLVIGLFTQLAALATLAILLGKLFKKLKAKALFTDGVNYYFILFVIAFSLLLTGPGAFAFDLPL